MADNVGMFHARPSGVSRLTLILFIAGICRPAIAQDHSTQQSWTTSNQLTSPSGTTNPTRSTTTHTEVDGRTVEKTVVEAVGPDGRYVPYSEIERESIRVNETTVRNIERSYGRTADGQRVLTQQTQEESQSLAEGEKKISRITSNPDGNGALQVVQRAMIESKQLGPGVRETNTTVFSADGSGGLSPTVRIQERESKTDASTVQFRNSTALADGTGQWKLSEIREGVTRQSAGGEMTQDLTVLRPDSEGQMAVAERTTRKLSAETGGDRSDKIETYSTDVPGQAGSEGLQLVRRESIVQRTNAGGGRSTLSQVQQTNPGDPQAGLRLTQETIDIVRPGANGTAVQTSTTRTSDSNGHLNTVWIDIGHTDNPAVVKVDTTSGKKPNQ